MYKEIKNLPRHFLIEEASLGCSEKNEIFPPYGKIGIPRTEHRMETMQAMEAPMDSALQLGKGGTECLRDSLHWKW
jgi:hypothetical protein